LTPLSPVDSIVAELRACAPDELPGVRDSFAAIASDPQATDAWRRLAEAAVLAVDRMAAGGDPADALSAFEADLTAAGIAAQAGADGRDGSRSKARRRRRSN
jgi:hypothetical protein